MHYLNEANILLFLVQVALLLGLARGLGEVFRRWGQPTITAEILVGVLLGPTILGRFLPGVHRLIFPDDVTQQNMLDTLAWLGILFFLLKTGLETSLTAAVRQGKQAAIISLSDLILPMVVAFVPALFLPDRYLGPEGDRIVFALFIATIMTISAMPVTARVLQDLAVYRTDLGLLIMSALTINDIAGWIVFALILGFATGGALSLSGIAFIVLATLVFAAICLTLGSRLVDGVLRRMERAAIPEPAGSLTLIAVAGMICGAVTVWIGIHALFGFFIAGIMTGEAKALSERTRHIFDQVVQAILVPVFFATIGLKVDFLATFDLLLVLFVLGIGIAGRYLGAWLGARAIRIRGLGRTFVAAAHVPGGEMQIVIGILALEYAVIVPSVFVAVVLGAILSSVIAGPWMHRVLGRLRRFDWTSGYCAAVPDVRAVDRDAAIRELCREAARFGAVPPAPALTQAVLERENTMTTAIDQGVAAPHARLGAITHPIVIIGRSLRGIDWNARDGLPAQLIFLVLTPADATDAQLRILRDISRATYPPENRAALLESQTAEQIVTEVRAALEREQPSAGPPS
jgi:Kef-type K+ transport system membrane component KefB/mannitol/fructose-specific phosphotransferase system IIA component (Ntr-type)